MEENKPSMVRYGDITPGQLEEGASLVPQNGDSRVRVETEGSHRGRKFLSLLLLTPHYAGVILLMRYVRTRPGAMFVTSTTVLLAEVFKSLACLVIIFVQQGGPGGWLSHLYEHLVMRPADFTKVCVPSLLFVVQNNLVFVAISNLDAATFQVTYQLKILTTAVFSVILLGKRLSKVQWFSLLLLFAGVSIIQAKQAMVRSPRSPPPSSSLTPSLVVGANTSSGGFTPSRQEREQNYVTGVVAVLVCCLLSGFANVFFEVLLKGGKQSVWLRNIQLGLSGSVLGAIACVTHDGVKIDKQGFFYGYDGLVWTVVMMQAMGGLLVATVIKYADNILKGFSTAGSVLLSCVAAVYLFDFQMDTVFMLGTGLVVLAVYFYCTNPATQSDQDLELTIQASPRAKRGPPLFNINEEERATEEAADDDQHNRKMAMHR